jgi:hypothetical protein
MSPKPALTAAPESPTVVNVRTEATHGSRPWAIIGTVLFFAAVNLVLLNRLPLQRALLALARNDAGVGASIAATGGTWQVTPVNTAFATPFKVVVKDFAGTPLGESTVMFSAPDTGPSGSFGQSTTATVVTNRDGIAVAPALTANGQTGGYTVTASVTGAGQAPAYFILTNSPAAEDQRAVQAPRAFSEAEARRALRFSVLLLDLCGFLAVAFYFIYAPFRSPNLDRHLFSIAAAMAVSASIFIILATFARDEYFAPLGTLMTNPSSLPVYGQRLLMIWIAKVVKVLLPSVSYRRAYLATQLLAIFGTAYTVGKWSALFVGEEWKVVGQLLLATMLLPTITYSTFYDIPMIGVYTLCLFLLYKKRYAYFLAALAIGTLNHENTLLLVPVAALVLWGVAPRRISLGIPLAALAGWGTMRMAVQKLIPATSHFEWHVWTNLMAFSHPTAELVKSVMTLAFWLICGALGFGSANQFVRRAAVLLPALVAVTFVAGRFVEARQFDAFIPVAIALILSCLHKLPESDQSHLLQPSELSRNADVFVDGTWHLKED